MIWSFPKLLLYYKNDKRDPFGYKMIWHKDGNLIIDSIRFQYTEEVDGV